jgi:hypothetical protein
MAATNVAFFRGQDVVLRFYQNNAQVLLPAKNWSVEQNAAEINEGVNGEYRDRLDLVTNFYSGSVDIYQADQKTMDSIIAAQAPYDNSTFPLTQYAAVLIRQRDGVTAGYALREAVFGPWNMNMSSRQDPVMLNIKFRFRFYEKLPI